MTRRHVTPPHGSAGPVSRRAALGRVAGGGLLAAAALGLGRRDVLAQEQEDESAVAIVRLFYDEVLNDFANADRAAVDLYVASDFTDEHNGFFYPAHINLDGLDGYRLLADAFPTMRFEAATTIADADLVMALFTFTGRHEGEFLGFAASGNDIAVEGIDLFRLQGGRLVQHWGFVDVLDLLAKIEGGEAESS